MKHAGTLSARVYYAGGAAPVVGARVHIFGGDADYSLFTDRSGLTVPVELEAPDAATSLTPNPDRDPYSTYEAEVSAEGFYPTRIIGIAIFDGIGATLPVELVPLSRVGAENNRPEGYSVTESGENGDLL